ncbi:MAG: helix-turn-helix domain-containing protein, partial [Candidatus Thermoplasmatota archaeon]
MIDAAARQFTGIRRLASDGLGLLLAHGLHESEARTYLTLLKHPSITAGTLSKIANVPRSHLYKVLQDLQNRGLAEVLLQGSARSYRARPLRGFLEGRENELQRQLGELSQEIATVADAFEPLPLDRIGEPGTGDVRIIVGRSAIAREIDEMLNAATDRVVLAGSAKGFERVLRHVLPHLGEDAGPKKPQFELILPRAAAANAGMARIRASPRVSVRWYEIERRMMSIVQDETGVLCVNPVPDTNDLRTGRDFGIYSGDRGFVDDHYRLLRAASHEVTDERATPAGRNVHGKHATRAP